MQMATTLGAIGAASAWIYDVETVKRFRPLARRRLSTIRPFLVFIRTRKP
jgi:hypothetical protein